MGIFFWLILLIVVAILYMVVKTFQINHYYNSRKIPQVKEIPVFGAFGSSLITRRHMNYVVLDLYNDNKSAKYSISHSFFSPMVIIRDLELAKTVLVKSFDHFSNNKTFVDERNDPLFGKNLAFLNGDKWRDVRNLLSPAFTASKMRVMHVLISQCAENFTEKFVKRYVAADEIDVKDVFSRFTNDVIATCAFGIEVDSLDNPNNEFYLAGKRCGFSNNWQVLKIFICSFFPSLTAKMGMRIIPQEVTDFFVNVVKTTIKTRSDRGISRPDMLQLMIDAREKSDKFSDYDIMEITAQAFIFFLAGFDTTSDMLSLIAHMLAVNPDVQERLHAEVDAVMKEHNGQPTYEAINNLPYLDAVFNETMRMHPVGGFVFRICSKEYELPPSLPDSEPMTVAPGTEVLVASMGIHYDPDYYENPDKFDPDRYVDKRITSDILNLGFGLGPRMCIGNRFAILEIKTVFVHLLAKCSFVPCKKTCIPFEYDANKFSPYPKGGFWLKIEPRKLN